MRYAPVSLLTLALFLLLPRTADAQQPPRRVSIDYEKDGIQVGFPASTGVIYSTDRFRPGLWAPVLVTFVDDPDGNIVFRPEADGSIRGELRIETADNVGGTSIYPRQFNLAANQPLRVLTYTKLANAFSYVTVTVNTGGKTVFRKTRHFVGLEENQDFYLTLGDKLPQLADSLMPASDKKEEINFNQRFRDGGPRHAGYVTNPQNLPDLWFGYNGVDMAILATSNDKFLDRLLRQKSAEEPWSAELKALTDWVRRGGRLVVSIAPENSEKVHRLLTSLAWQPALPPVLPLDAKTIPLVGLDEFQRWSEASKPLPGVAPDPKKGVKGSDRVGVRLETNPAVTVLCRETRDRQPLIVRFPHGTGSITLLAFDVKAPFITNWDSRSNFWQAVVKKLAPVGNSALNGMVGDDPTSQLYFRLEQFDTSSISFGWVALFILIYILVVGPLDYIILKMVFKRLELTWVTFPAVVLTVSVIAYFTAYAVKGQDLLVNKVDLIDIDMRSALGPDLQPAGATAYGTTWFTIRSPRVQNYTIGIEPVLHNWQPGAAPPARPIEPTMSWMGWSDRGGFGGRGRRESGGLFSRSYSFEHDAVGLQGVPIPVWTNKSFTASWVAPFDPLQLPLESKLTYAVGKRDASVSGTIQNNLAVDLRDVGIVNGNQFYKLDPIPKGAVAKIQIDLFTGQDLAGWAQQQSFGTGLSGMMFHEKAGMNRNHAHRPLDWSWRLRQETVGEDVGVKDIILVARVGNTAGGLEELHLSNDPLLPTHLWLGQLPGTPVPGNINGEKVPAFQPRPKMEGKMTQETYVRVILPVVPRK